MAKNRKTRKEKMRAEKRHATLPSSPTADRSEVEKTTTYRIAPEMVAQNSSMRTTSTATLSYLKDDLLRTGIVTGAIILAEIILFFTLQSR